MFATDNDYEEAIRGSSIHAHERKENKKRVLIRLLSFSTGAVLLYLGFNYYKQNLLDEELKITSEPKIVHNLLDNSKISQEVSKIANKEENVDKKDEYLTALEKSKESPVATNVSLQDDEYLLALDSMEVDVLDDSKSKKEKDKNKDNLTQVNLNEAISNIVDKAMVDNSKYTNELKKELVVKSKPKSRVIVVQKGDTLESISKKIYGNPMKYKEIMARNSNILNNPSDIYEGQIITLPY